MHEKLTHMGQHGGLARPSATTDTPWLWASAPRADPQEIEAPDSPGGKWLWFLPVRALDAGWQQVRQAVEEGKLGPAAKVATLGNPFDGDPTRRPVIVYTADCNHVADVERVLVALRSLGINDALAYKTDEATSLGEYGDRTSAYTSPVGTTKIVNRIPRYTAST
jgi:hypothetical protein